MADHEILEQKLKDNEDSRVELEGKIFKLTNDHDEEVKRLNDERDDAEAKAEKSELHFCM